MHSYHLQWLIDGDTIRFLDIKKKVFTFFNEVESFQELFLA